MSTTYFIEFSDGESPDLALLELHYRSGMPITITDSRGIAKTVWVTRSSLQLSYFGPKWSISVIEGEASCIACVTLSGFEWPNVPRAAEPAAAEKPAKVPEVPFEVHNPRKVSADRAIEAVRQMSKGT